MSFLNRRVGVRSARLGGAQLGWAVGLLVALASGCSSEALCDDGACAEPTNSDAGMSSSDATNTPSPEAGGMTTATETTSDTLDDTNGAGGMDNTSPISDAGPLLDASADSGLDASVADGGLLDGSIDAGPDAALDGSFTPVEADGSTDDEACLDCECLDNFECLDPTPICGPTHVCIQCDDSDNFGCSGKKPWCLGGPSFPENKCVECRGHTDCDDDSFPACENNECVTCSIVDNNGCGVDAPLCVQDNGGNNHCVQCIDAEDCGGDTPICEDSVCIPCSTRMAESGDDGCSDEAAPRCLAGDSPTENSCVECLEGGDCDAERPLCTDDNTCVECLTSANCNDEAAPRCDDTGTCAGCEADEDCDSFDGATQCDVQSGACVECTSDDNCPNAAEAACGEDFTCGACAADSDCEHLDGLSVCDAGTCVECSVEDESACGANSCNPATRQCTNTPRSSVSTCRACVADSECESESYRCVPLNFDGQPHGSYCMKRQSAGCSRPYLSPLTAASLSGAASEGYCGINQALTTCEAIRDLSSSETCQADDDCGEGLGGLCATVGIAANRCTYQCGSADECTGTYTCDDDGPGDEWYCH